MKKFICLSLLIFICFSCFSIGAQAQEEKAESAELTVSPTIIDEKAIARDILKYDIKIKNNTDRKITIYAMVNDISETGGRQDFVSPQALDKTTSLARWILFRRAVIELMPGESKVEPLEIQVNLEAVPGKRHAAISFTQGNNRPMAKENLLTANYPQLMINLEIEEEIIEKAQAQKFRTSRNLYFKFPIDFIFNINNFGNREINPIGYIYIFNRRGSEVAKISINKEEEKIAPEESKEFLISWDDVRGIGKFKAKLEVEYGEKDKRDIQDTVYFWVLPLKFLIIFIGGLLFIVVMATIILFRKTYRTRHHLPHEHHQAVSDGVLDLKKKG